MILSIVAIFATCLGSILAANTLTLSLYFRLTFTKVAILTGWYLLGVGIGAILFVPSARIWGKRHQFILGTVLIFISCIWAGAVRHNYNSLAGKSPILAQLGSSEADKITWKWNN